MSPRRVLVVGASSAIGAAVIDTFRREGGHVLATYARNGRTDDEGLQWRALDLSDMRAVDAFAAALRAEPGSAFDAVVMLAGALPGQALQDYEGAAIDHVMRVNFSGQAQLIGGLLPCIADGGVVVMMASISGERGSFDPIYAAAKAAVVGFVKSMATWHAPRLRFVAVAPALVEDSSMMEAMAPERREHHRAASPLKRLITPEELAAVVHDLTQPHWAHANGTCVRINGGAYV